MQDKIEALEQKRKEITFQVGQKEVVRQILTAEILALCQDAVNTNNEIMKLKSYQAPAPKLETVPVPPAEVQLDAHAAL